MVIWSKPAEKDLRQIFEYIARDSKFYAKKVVKNIVERSMSLESSPRRGRMVPEINDPDIREIFIYSYRLMYQITPDNIYILGVIHGKRDFTPDDIL
jgi:plasmid stabilization system protein ParE